MDGSEKIAVVEDDAVVRDLLGMTLAAAGVAHVCACARGDEGLRMVLAERPDALLLDWRLPGLEGLEVCRRLRAERSCAELGIIMLTAKGEPEDIVAGLDAGADDYVVKPFSRAVLMARLAAVLRRKAPSPDEDFDGLRVEAASGAVSLDGALLSLTRTEHRMLSAFVRHPARVYTRAHLAELAGGGSDGLSRTVDVQIAGLRRKLGRWAAHLETIRGVGYRVRP